MNNLLSYCGLVEVRIIASEKDLPVPSHKLGCSYAIWEEEWVFSRCMPKGPLKRGTEGCN